MSYDTFCSRSFTRAEDEAGIISRATEKGWYYKEGILCNTPFEHYQTSEDSWSVGITGIEREYRTGIAAPYSWIWMRGAYDDHHLNPGALAYVLDCSIADEMTHPTGPEDIEATPMSEVVYNLNDNHVAQIKNAVDVAYLFGIEPLIIGSDSVRGVEGDDQSVCIIGKGIDLPVASIITPAVSMLKHTLDIAQDFQDRTFQVKTVGTEVKISIKGTYEGMGMKVEHTCAPVGNCIRAPGKVRDTFTNTLLIPSAVANHLNKIFKDLRLSVPESIVLRSEPKRGWCHVFLELRDDRRQDVVSYKLESEPVKVPFCNFYAHVMLNLLRFNPEGLTLEVGEKGVLKTNINGIDVFVLPMAESIGEREIKKQWEKELVEGDSI